MTDNVRSRFSLSFVPGSGLRIRDLTVLHKRDEIRQQRKLVANLDLLYRKILGNGCRVFAKNLSHCCKGVMASVSIRPKSKLTLSRVSNVDIAKQASNIDTRCDIGAAISTLDFFTPHTYQCTSVGLKVIRSVGIDISIPGDKKQFTAYIV